MTVRVAINGFGRIGRLVMRAIAESKRTDLVVVGINDLGSPDANAHLLKYNSVHGRYPGEVTVKGDMLNVGSASVKVTAEKDPTKLPWKDLGVEVALECTGIFTKRDKAALHLEAGAKRVLVSAPADGADHYGGQRRQPHAAQARDESDLERLVHHQLPRAGGQGAQRPVRHRTWLHDHGALPIPATRTRSTRCTRTCAAPAPPRSR